VLRTETLAALGASPAEQTATTLGGHAGAETVGARAMQITGIECTFHSDNALRVAGENFGLKQ
jgi:hypothetical protein